MSSTRPELMRKLNSVVNRYGSDEKFVEHMSDWPRTIKDLIYSSEALMLRFNLICLLPEPDETEFVGLE